MADGLLSLVWWVQGDGCGAGGGGRRGGGGGGRAAGAAGRGGGAGGGRPGGVILSTSCATCSVLCVLALCAYGDNSCNGR